MSNIKDLPSSDGSLTNLLPLPEPHDYATREAYTADQLRAYAAACVAAQWVRCDERMPEDCVEVLVAVGPSIYIAEREDGEWWAVDRMPSQLGGVTHWMPLPAPPKE